jgi:hypothetical protein
MVEIFLFRMGKEGSAAYCYVCKSRLSGVYM